MESEHSLLTKSHEKLQITLNKYDVPSSSTSTCDHANIIEENARLKNELAKASSPQGEKPLYEILQMQNPHIGKEGIGFVSKTKKKKNKKKKTMPAQAKEKNIVGGDATRGSTPRSDFAGHANPNYILYVDYYGDVYAKYVGPYDGFIAYSIWVPKTLVANKR